MEVKQGTQKFGFPDKGIFRALFDIHRRNVLDRMVGALDGIKPPSPTIDDRSRPVGNGTSYYVSESSVIAQSDVGQIIIKKVLPEKVDIFHVGITTDRKSVV